MNTDISCVSIHYQRLSEPIIKISLNFQEILRQYLSFDHQSSTNFWGNSKREDLGEPARLEAVAVEVGILGQQALAI